MGEGNSAPEGPDNHDPLDPDSNASHESRLAQRKRERAEKRLRAEKRWRWLAGVGSGVLVGLLTWGVTAEFPGVAHQVIKWFSPPSAAKTATPHAGASSAHPAHSQGGGSAAGRNETSICWPQVASENSLDSGEVSAWTFPGGWTPAASQIADINEAGKQADLVNRYLYNDGGYAPSTDTQLIIQNNCSKPAIVTDMQAVKSCQAPNDGAIFIGQPQLSAASPTTATTAAESDTGSTQIGLNLDSVNPEAMLANGSNYTQWRQEYAAGSLATIASNSDYTFDIHAIAPTSACEFSIQITYLYDGESHIENITDQGQPFRVSALLPGLPGAPGAKSTAKHPYSGYGLLYVGWQASPWPDESWVRENPKTWP
jgi:hypothetical protein